MKPSNDAIFDDEPYSSCNITAGNFVMRACNLLQESIIPLRGWLVGFLLACFGDWLLGWLLADAVHHNHFILQTTHLVF